MVGDGQNSGHSEAADAVCFSLRLTVVLEKILTIALWPQFFHWCCSVIIRSLVRWSVKYHANVCSCMAYEIIIRANLHIQVIFCVLFGGEGG